jgi:hypothetical protein
MLARSRFAVIAPLVLVALGVAAAAGSAQAATITVTDASDANAGSLRRAIETAEQQSGHDTIKFDIPGAGLHTITLASDLPGLSDPVTIKGYSQPGAVRTTSTTPAEPAIEIDAGNVNVNRGLDIGGSDIEVRGLAIHSAQGANVFIEGHDVVLAGNHLGTDPAGRDAVPAGTTCNVEIYGAGNLIGGPLDVDRNVIAGAMVELCVRSGDNEIANNRIGTSADGTGDLGHGNGVELHLGASGSLVRDNLVSGLAVGIEVRGDGNTLQGNRVGTDADGTAAIPNGTGVNVEGADENTIGGTLPGEGNVISGNAYEGLQLERGDDVGYEEIGPAVGNRVLGNLIGTDRSGAVPLGNGSTFGLQGIVINASDTNTIGGHEPGAGNVIAANTGDGLDISGTGNVVLGNAIGTNMDGALGLGNGRNGVHITAGENDIGAEAGASMNTIAYNGEDGVAIEGTAPANTLVRNLIFVNGTSTDDVGIDLDADGVTANDGDDVDSGPNDLLNHPLITAVDTAAGTVGWTLDGLESTNYRLEFYASPFCDGSGSGEGQHYLGYVNVNTNSKGWVRGTTATATPPATGDHVTMTATRRTFTGLLPLTTALHETSEFSPCEAA